MYVCIHKEKFVNLCLFKFSMSFLIFNQLHRFQLIFSIMFIDLSIYPLIKRNYFKFYFYHHMNKLGILLENKHFAVIPVIPAKSETCK